MSRNKLELLKELESELLAELAKVRDLMSSYGAPVSTPPEVADPKKDRKPISRGEGVPRKNQTWDVYIQTILKEIGGKGKTNDVYNYAVSANPSTSVKTIHHAIRGKISKLYRKGLIGAHKGDNKKDGYEYFIKPASNGSPVANNKILEMA